MLTYCPLFVDITCTTIPSGPDIGAIIGSVVGIVMVVIIGVGLSAGIGKYYDY